jgi:N-acetylglucosamine-6-phosphate deacetylase
VPPPPGDDATLIAGIAGLAPTGTQILGIFFEGPYLGHPGAMPEEAMGEPEVSRVERLIEAAGDVPIVFAVAPEVPGVVELIPAMRRNGTPVFITHSSATVEQGQAAIEAGARHGTHFYDVFPCRDVEDPGVRPCSVVEALLADPRASVDFILDGEHVHPVAVQMALQCKGPDRVCLITDANLGAGYPPGVYKGLGDTEVEFAYDGAPARMTKNTRIPGVLAGSGLTMNRAVRNAVDMLNVDLPLAVRMASANPAQLLGLDDRKGRIQEGYDADVVLLNEDFSVAATWIGGRRVWGEEA